MMSSLAVSQPNYIPWKGYFELISKVDNFVIFDTVQFTKRDWRTRNKLIGTDGQQIWLSIPVKSKDRSRSLIKDIYVVDNKWRRKHFATIQSCYGKAEYFSQYEQIFKDLYLGSEEENLSAINLMFINKICEILKIDTKIHSSQDYESGISATEKLLRESSKYKATLYVTGPSAASYLDLPRFKCHGIDVSFIKYRLDYVYPQKSCVFSHHVSVLDLIFNVGPSAKRYIGN
ncbi:WbqC family protein [Alphaproteobacteria bacterium]|nr:WbqC family protein [Alphaproteobacteria bacterium]MDB4858493.1 WbqC family protein [Alphaproteobacteria bacterium]MDC6458361.1 WbqC family protein [Alphaproteobacteria bacterium]